MLFILAFFTVLIIISCYIGGLETADSAANEREVRELREQVQELTTACGNLRRRHVSLEQEVRDRVSIIDHLQSRTDQMNESLAQQTGRINDLESPRGPPAHEIHNGIFLWKIEDYQKKRQDAIHGVKTTLYSRPFYTDPHGYKMCAVIYLNGDGVGKGSHLSLFFAVMRGELITYDLCNKFIVGEFKLFGLFIWLSITPYVSRAN